MNEIFEEFLEDLERREKDSEMYHSVFYVPPYYQDEEE